MLLPLTTSFVIAFLLSTYFVVGGILFAIRYYLYGDYLDQETARRGSSVLIIGLIRNYFAWLIRPVLSFLVLIRVSPNAVTAFSVVVAAGAGLCAASGLFSLAGWLYIASGVCDFLDGRLARVTGKVTQSGSVLDSILDRYSESAMLFGLMWFYRHEWVLVALLFFLAGSFLVPYIRARGEALGIQLKVGLMQRPERMVILGVSTVMSPILEFGYPIYSSLGVRHPLVVAVGVFLAITTQATAAHRLWHLLKHLEGMETELPPAASPAIALGTHLWESPSTTLADTRTPEKVQPAGARLSFDPVCSFSDIGSWNNASAQAGV